MVDVDLVDLCLNFQRDGVSFEPGTVSCADSPVASQCFLPMNFLSIAVEGFLGIGLIDVLRIGVEELSCLGL